MSKFANTPEPTPAGLSHRGPSRCDRALAQVCRNCPVCRRARRNQRGLTYHWVKQVENRICPFCRAYARVFGRKAHERAP